MNETTDTIFLVVAEQQCQGCHGDGYPTTIAMHIGLECNVCGGSGSIRSEISLNAALQHLGYCKTADMDRAINRLAPDHDLV